METPVDSIYNEFKLLDEFLSSKNEISFRMSSEAQFKKNLIMASASFFETEIVKLVTEYCIEISSDNKAVMSFIRNKAIKRQYHTYFEWDIPNGYNRFFGMFGEDFKNYMSKRLKSDNKLKISLEAFIKIGNERNLLTHLNFASYDVTKTIEELYELYRLSLNFIEELPSLFRSDHQKA